MTDTRPTPQRARPGAPIVLLTLLSALLLCAGHAAAQTPPPRRANEQLPSTEARLQSNDFNVGRGLQEYRQYLGPEFARDMERWHTAESMTVLDAGAGEGRALLELADRAAASRAARQPGAPGLRLIAVGVVRPETTDQAALARHADRMNYHEGRLGERGRALENRIGRGSVDRIVDVYGATHYTPRFDRVIRAYGTLLRPGGRVYLHVDPMRLQFTDARNQRVSPVDFLRRVQGFRVVHTEAFEPPGFEGTGLEHHRVVLERTDARPVATPRVTVRTMLELPNTTPQREYTLGAGRDRSVLHRAIAHPQLRRVMLQRAQTRRLLGPGPGLRRPPPFRPASWRRPWYYRR